MNSPFDLERSPEDETTFRKWRRGLVVFYGAIGLVFTAAIAAHFVNAALHVASR
jgi:hypothetical protein